MVGAGQRVGRYSIIKAVGLGPNFETFQARAFGVEGFERDVALKVVTDPASVESAEFREALARALELSHAGVLQLVDSDTADFDGTTRLYLVTELARGESLAQLLSGWRSTPEGRSRILRATSEVARVLDYAHRRRKGPVAHGRLHAGQIFVGARGEVKVADFAVARAIEGRGAATPADDLTSFATLLAAAFEGLPSPQLDQLIAAMRAGAVTAQGVSETLLELAVQEPQPIAQAPAPIDLALLSPPPPDTAELVAEVLAASPNSTEVRPQEAEVRRRIPPAGRFVGRSEELTALGSFVARVHQAGARWLRVRGPDGLGKTRLLRELARRLPQEKVGFVFPPLSEEPGAQLSLQAMNATLRCVLDLPKTGSFDVDGLTSSLRAMGLTLEEISCLCGLMGASLACDEPVPSGAEALLSLVAALRGGRPVAIAFEDGARVDQASRDLLLDALAAERARTVPLAVLSIERATGASTEAHCEDFMLEELSDDDLAQLISARLGARVIEPELFEAVSENVGGHPLYAEEYLRYLCEEALVDVKGGVASLVHQAPPPTRSVLDLVAAAHEQLRPELREVIKTLKARTGVADGATVAAALNLEETLAERYLLELARAGFLRFDARNRAHLALVHRGIGEAADNEIHARLAAHFASVGAFADAAQHHAAAGDHLASADGWEAAAKGLWADGLVEAATDALSRALLHPRTKDQAEARLALLVEWLPRVAGLPDAAEEGIASALALVEDLERSTSLRLALVGPLLELGAYEAALVLNDQAASLSEDISAAVARNRLAIAVLAGNPRLAPDLPLELDQSSPKHGLDVAELALLRGELGSCASSLAPLANHLEPLDGKASGALRVRYLRVLLNLAYSSVALATDDPRLDELMAVTQSVRPHREAAESFLFVGRVLKNAALTSKERARVNAIFNQAARFADEAHHHRGRTLALAESALLTKREAAVSAALALANQQQASGDNYLSLRLRLAVVELTQEQNAVRRFIADAGSHDLAGLATRLAAQARPNRGD